MNKLICHKGQEQSKKKRKTVRASKEKTIRRLSTIKFAVYRRQKQFYQQTIWRIEKSFINLLDFSYCIFILRFYPINSSLIKFISGLDPKARSQKQIVNLTIGKLSHYQQLSG